MGWVGQPTHLWFKGAMIAPAEGTASSQSKYHSLPRRQMGRGGEGRGEAGEEERREDEELGMTFLRVLCDIFGESEMVPGEYK